MGDVAGGEVAGSGRVANWRGPCVTDLDGGGLGCFGGGDFGRGRSCFGGEIDAEWVAFGEWAAFEEAGDQRGEFEGWEFIKV